MRNIRKTAAEFGLNIEDCVPKTKKIGRPKGSKNKKTLEREALEAASAEQIIKRGRGRPKGSKNKTTLAREAAEAAAGIVRPKRGRGRPKGSRNKKTLTDESKPAAIVSRDEAK
ncbi:MAG: hypothetical protein K6G15_03615 [Desulfovibrio sp.]|nr:hypothetical protein [Desulfovibrio sp.]